MKRNEASNLVWETTERIPQIPTDTEQNDLGLEVTPFEWSGGIHENCSS
jgi:hypothetical protein